MTITALLQLAEDDRLSLEDPIGGYVPGLPNATSPPWVSWPRW